MGSSIRPTNGNCHLSGVGVRPTVFVGCWNKADSFCGVLEIVGLITTDSVGVITMYPPLSLSMIFLAIYKSWYSPTF